MADKPKKTGRQNYDWDVIKLDYISNPKSSINQISEKYGIRRATVAQKSRENGWANAKKEYLQKVSTKARKNYETTVPAHFRNLSTRNCKREFTDWGASQL